MSAERGSWGSLFSSASRPIAIIIAVGIALHSANIYVASAVMPSVTDDIGGLSLYAWATTVFVFAAVLGSIATVTLLARSGIRGAYRLAILTVGAGTVVCALAPTMPVLLAGRFIQGLGGGLLFALAYTLVRLVLAQRLWPYAMSLISAMWGVGTFCGPALGGSLAQIEQWRLAFWIIVPITLFFAVWGAAKLPRDAGRQEQTPATPWLGVGLLGASVLVLSAASVSTQPAVNLIGIASAAALLGVWLRHERTTGKRLLPSVTFTDGGRLRWLYITMALLMIAATPEVFVSYFAQQLQGLEPLAAGYLATAIAAGWTTASLVLGSAEHRRRSLLRFAPLISAAGLVLLVAIGPIADGGAPVIAGIAVGFVLLGWGIGTAWPHLVTAVLSTVPSNQGDLAGASITTVQLTAAAAGAAIGGAVTNLAGFADPGGLAGAQDAARWLYIAILAAPLLALLTVRLATRREPKRIATAPAPHERPLQPAAELDGSLR